MKWDESFCIGCKKIDLQHQKLVEYVDRLSQTVANSENSNKVYETLGFLVEYARTHFADEEEIMAAVDFPFLNEQKHMHDGFIDFVTGILLDLQNGGACNFVEMQEYLEKWIVNHVLHEDIKIGQFFRDNNHKCEIIGKENF